MKTILVLLCLFFTTTTQAADNAIRFQVGVNTAEAGKVGWWRQPPLPSTFNNETRAAHIEYSRALNNWIGISIGYHDLGRFNGHGYFVIDQNYDPGTGEVEYPCWRCGNKKYAYHAKYFGDLEFVHVAMEPTWHVTDSTALYAQLGGAIWKGKFETWKNDNSDSKATPHLGYKNRARWAGRGISPYLGLGATYEVAPAHSVVLSAYRISGTRPKNSIAVANRGLSMGYQVSF